MSSATPRRSTSPDLERAIFVDHAAGSPLRHDVAAAMAEALVGLPPNPSGAHRLARATASVLERAREELASMAGVPPHGVIFTGGGTESCNLGVRGPRSISEVWISAVEHVAVRNAAQRASAERGVPLGTLGVDAAGRLDVDAALDQISAGALVSVMAANNETGVIQPLAALRAALDDAGIEVVLHVDAIAAAPTMDLAAVLDVADLVSIAGHKLGGPPGTGALVVRGEVGIDPILVGGGQELERRAGTQDVAGAVGLVAALRAADADRRHGAVADLALRRARFEQVLRDQVPGIEITAADAPRLASHTHVLVEGCRSEELLVLLDERGVCASAGAACASGAPQASVVLLAMGISPDRARGSLRFSAATTTSDDKLATAADALGHAVRQLTR